MTTKRQADLGYNKARSSFHLSFGQQKKKEILAQSFLDVVFFGEAV